MTVEKQLTVLLIWTFVHDVEFTQAMAIYLQTQNYRRTTCLAGTVPTKCACMQMCQNQLSLQHPNKGIESAPFTLHWMCLIFRGRPSIHTWVTMNEPTEVPTSIHCLSWKSLKWASTSINLTKVKFLISVLIQSFH